MSRRRRKPPKLPDPVDVIEERVSLGVRELIALIRKVNPTTRQLTGAATERRYYLKNRLQEILVRDFADELRVRADSRDERLVVFEHRPTGKTACHARIDELDDDTRRWIRGQLDEQALRSMVAGTRAREEGPGARTEVRGDDDRSDASGQNGGAERASDVASTGRDREPDPELPQLIDNEGREGRETLELVAIGERAMASYDFERAKDCFWRAFEQSGGAVEAALPLLDLLVENLASYTEALEASAGLSERAMRRGEIRGLLALAAARSGAAERAIGWLEGASKAQSARVYRDLARYAVQAGDGLLARRYLAEAKARDPRHHEVLALEEDIAKL